jgi:predicted DNA-binding transcriptional regulator AlpA
MRLFDHSDDIDILPDIGFVRLPSVLRRIPVSKSTWYAGIKSGKYPKPYKISDDASGWDVDDIRRCIAERKEQQR